MNKKQLALMLGSIVRLHPAPFLIEERRYLTKTDWRITSIQVRRKTVRLRLETLSGALGLMLDIYHDSIMGFEHEDLHYQSNITQGVLRLKVQWFIPPEGNTAFRKFM